MNILRNGFIYNASAGLNIQVADEKNIDSLSHDELLKVRWGLNANTIQPCFRLYILHDNETPNIDISDDFISGDLSVTYQAGQRRTLNVTLLNKDNKYKPSPINSLIWVGTKFRLDTGILVDGVLYWKPQGIFVLKSPSRTKTGSNQTISLSLCDKFGLLDSSVRGNSSLRNLVPVNVSMYQAFYTLLTLDIGNGQPYDLNDIRFDKEYKDIKTYYTITKEEDDNIGSIFTELGESISCDVYYDEYGYMNVKSNAMNFINHNFEVVHMINETDRGVTFSIAENFDKIINKVIVKGAIVNGYRFTATVENKSPASPYCIQQNGEFAKTIKDEAIYSDTLCMDRAMYEMINFSRGVKTLNITCPFMPLLDVNKSILITSEDYEFDNDNFVIDTFSMQINNSPTMSISATNINEVNF